MKHEIKAIFCRTAQRHRKRTMLKKLEPFSLAIFTLHSIQRASISENSSSYLYLERRWCQVLGNIMKPIWSNQKLMHQNDNVYSLSQTLELNSDTSQNWTRPKITRLQVIIILVTPWKLGFIQNVGSHAHAQWAYFMSSTFTLKVTEKNSFKAPSKATPIELKCVPIDKQEDTYLELF